MITLALFTPSMKSAIYEFRSGHRAFASYSGQERIRILDKKGRPHTTTALLSEVWNYNGGPQRTMQQHDVEIWERTMERKIE